MTHRFPRIAVLLAVYNGSKWLDDQIVSVLDQKDVHVSIIVSDDCSSDGSLNIIRHYIDLGFDIRLLPIEAVGGAAKNFFRLVASVDADDFDFVAFCDQDDVWAKDKLISAVNSLQGSNASGYSCSVKTFGDAKQVVLSQSSKTTAYDYFFEGAGQGCTFLLDMQFFKVVQKNIFDLGGRLNYVHYHDWLVYVLCRVHGGEWFFDPRVFLNYRQHLSNDTGSKYSFSGIKKRFSLIADGWYGNQIFVIINCVLFVDPGNKQALFLRRGLERSSRYLFNRLCFSLFLLFNSRRRFSDRIIVSFSEMFGLISNRKVNDV